MNNPELTKVYRLPDSQYITEVYRNTWLAVQYRLSAPNIAILANLGVERVCVGGTDYLIGELTGLSDRELKNLKGRK